MNGFEHGGNVYEAAETAGCSVDEIIDLSSNVSPYTPDTLISDLDIKALISRLPEPYSKKLVQELALRHDVPENTLLAGSGTTEFIHKICRLFSGKKAVILQPTYVDYERYARISDMTVTNVVMTEESGFRFDDEELMGNLSDAALCFICNPNNPTGKLIWKDDIRFVADMFKNTLFILDESYADFCTERPPSLIGCSLTNIVILKSFSKSYGIPGLRAGYICCRNKPLMENLAKAVSPWNMNTIAQEVCLKALRSAISPNMHRLDNNKHATMAKLAEIDDIKVYDSVANFLLLKLKRSDSASFCEYMLSHKILIRDCSNFVGLDSSFVRIAIKRTKEMELFCRLAKTYFEIF